jgi:hypothetical protein
MKHTLLLLLLTPMLSSADWDFCTMNFDHPSCAPSVDFRTDYNSPKVYDRDGVYRGNLNNNRFDPNSISNPHGKYGNPLSPDSLNNPYSPHNLR